MEIWNHLHLILQEFLFFLFYFYSVYLVDFLFLVLLLYLTNEFSLKGPPNFILIFILLAIVLNECFRNHLKDYNLPLMFHTFKDHSIVLKYLFNHVPFIFLPLFNFFINFYSILMVYQLIVILCFYFTNFWEFL